MSQKRHELDQRHQRASVPSLRNWEKPWGPAAQQMTANAVLDMGWGRLIFAHTFPDQAQLVQTLCGEGTGQRDIAFYLRDPHVVLAMAPHKLFLDPSHTYRLHSHQYRPSEQPPQGLVIRRIRTLSEAREINRIYAGWNMVNCDPQFMLERNASRVLTYLIAESTADHAVVGTVTGIDHTQAFNDSEHGSSLWCLAVDPQCQLPGVGEALVRQLAAYYFAQGKAYIDLSVMHNNDKAIALYEKLGFQRVPVFCVKHKNPINEPLFVAPQPQAELNVYGKIIVDEALRRGIAVEVVDAEAGFITLSMGGRSVSCRESLTELTTAVAMSRCDDKRVTRRLWEREGLRVPAGQDAGSPEADAAFLARHKSVVVKPARGEQGAGISVDIRSEEELASAIEAAKRVCDQVLLEECVDGQDLRVIVINYQVVAAAVRRPAIITGDGRHTIGCLIEKYNRRRMAATSGESRVPLDGETQRCIRAAGYDMQSVLPAGCIIPVRRTANLHTGGTIHDVTDQLHPKLVEVSQAAARALDIPVTGLDLLVPEPSSDEYVLIEANERPGLANHEPAPTAEKFIDFLFPQTVRT